MKNPKNQIDIQGDRDEFSIGFGKGDYFNFCQNIILSYLFMYILINKAKTQKNKRRARRLAKRLVMATRVKSE